MIQRVIDAIDSLLHVHDYIKVDHRVETETRKLNAIDDSAVLVRDVLVYECIECGHVDIWYGRWEFTGKLGKGSGDDADG